MTDPKHQRPNRGLNGQFLWLCAGVAIFLLSCFLLSLLSPKALPEPELSTVPPETIAESQPEETSAPTEAPEEPELPWNLLLVNPWNPIPQDFTVELTQLNSGHALDARAYDDLQTMLSDMRKEKLSPLICSSFRTNEKQQSLFQRKVKTYLDKGYSLTQADEEAGKWIAVPGTSEHETGLALDIVDSSYPYLNEKQENTRAQKWLMANSWRYGFILRYPNEKTEITGIYYEPWHYRYVGKEAAKEIFEQGICLEEYLEKG